MKTFSFALVLSFLLPAVVAAQGPQPLTLEQLRQARQEAAHRPPRLIFNNDGNEPIHFCQEATPQAVLEARTSALAHTQVESIYYCTWSSGFGIFTHNTRLGEVFTSKENPPAKDNTRGGYSHNIMAELLAQGTDPLKIMVQWCHEHQKEAFWSFRMNDTHDAGKDWYAASHFPKLKQEHPDWLIGSREQRPKIGRWSSVDYGRPEIRELALRFTEEVCQNYDVDGVELDFLRHATFFKHPAQGEDATPEELDAMTDLMRRLRTMTETEGCRRGRPILVSIRVYDSAEACRAIGLDVTRWMEEGLIDRLAVSDYFRLNPWETSVAWGHQYGVPVYAGLSESRLKDAESQRLRQSNECYRGRAAEAWAAGVDGIYMFNFFNPKSPLWSELGDLATLNGKDQLYTTGARGAKASRAWIAKPERFLHRQFVQPEQPLVLQPGQPATVELRVGQAPGPGSPKVQLRLRVGKAPTDGLTVALNGHALANATPAKGWLEYAVDPSWLVVGVNRLELSRPNAAAPLTIDDLVLAVRYPKP